MNPKILCGKCSQEIRSGDTYCPSCGSVIEWEALAGKTPGGSAAVNTTTTKSNIILCPHCGTQNQSGSSHCANCGAEFAGARKTSRNRGVQPAPSPAKPPPFSILQNWKIFAGIALLLIAAIVFFKTMDFTGGGEKTTALPPDAHQNQAVMSELENLEKAVQADPNNAQALLSLANHLQDAQFFPKAVETYKRYIAMKPDNPDAHVDLGVTYYQMASADTMRQAEYLQLAQDKFQEGLKLSPKHQLANFNLGIVSLMRGDVITANEWFKKTISIDSTSETGKRAASLIHEHTMTIKPS